MEVRMADSAEDQRFPFPGCHDFHPERLLAAFVSVEIFECSNVMHFDGVSLASGSTDLTDLGQESLFEFRSAVPPRWWPVHKGCFDVPCQRDPSPCRYKWLLSFAWHREA